MIQEHHFAHSTIDLWKLVVSDKYSYDQKVGQSSIGECCLSVSLIMKATGLQLSSVQVFACWRTGQILIMSARDMNENTESWNRCTTFRTFFILIEGVLLVDYKKRKRNVRFLSSSMQQWHSIPYHSPSIYFPIPTHQCYRAMLDESELWRFLLLFGLFI